MSRRRLAPEVVQTSAMDCGPACLKSLIEGLGGSISYGRLREACQTDVDGTSIDTLEDVARVLGLDAEQVLVPPDDVLAQGAGHLPCLAIVRLPDGTPHFVVLWRRHGAWVQVMDPAVGRRWSRARRVESELLVHEMDLDASAWRAWAAGEGFCEPLVRRLLALGVREGERLLAAAREEPGWRALATLDAAARLAGELRGARVASRARAAELVGVLAAAAAEADDPCTVIPARFWSARPATPAADGTEQVRARGAVLLQASGYDAGAVDREALSRELAAALTEAPARPGRELIAALDARARALGVVLALGLALAAGGLVLESGLFSAALDVGRSLVAREQRLVALGALVALLALLLALELPLAHLVQRVARGLETRLRVRLLEKLPRLETRYFNSRPVSDMAERAHAVHRLRDVVPLAAGAWRVLAEVVALSIGLAWLAPHSLPLSIALALACLVPPLLLTRPLSERDLRQRTHEGALSQFHLDALVGGVPAAAHGIEPAMLAEHEGLLVEWARAGRSTVSAATALTALHGLLVHGLGAWLVIAELGRHAEPTGALLLVLWVMTMIWLSEPLGLYARTWPTLRNLVLRLVEPMGAPEEPVEAGAADEAPAPREGGVRIELVDVSVHAGGHALLGGVDLVIEPGSHVAVVGASGAGKSSLCGLLLGWHRPTQGQVRIDGAPLDARALEALRRRTAWMDPQVQLWNRSLADNVRYGADPDGAAPDLAGLCEAAELHALLPRLPLGLQTPLGESGALVSGGEGQRVRAARAFARAAPRLVVMDEALRGLDQARRERVLARARERFAGATLLHVTHRLEEVLGFERALVLDGGRVVEDGAPLDLARRADSRFARMLEHERACAGVWEEGGWRRVELDDGRLVEAGG